MPDYRLTPIEVSNPAIEKLRNSFGDLYQLGEVGLWSYQIEGDTTDSLFEEPDLPERTLELVEEFMNDDTVLETCEPMMVIDDNVADEDEEEEEDEEEHDSEHDQREMSEEFASEIAEAFEMLNLNKEDIDALNGDQVTINWAESGPFVAEGVITNLLMAGGLYTDFPGSINDARRLSADFMDALIEDRHLQAQVAICDEPWSPWFNFSVGAFSMVIYDKPVKRFHLFSLNESADPDAPEPG